MHLRSYQDVVSAVISSFHSPSDVKVNLVTLVGDYVAYQVPVMGSWMLPGNFSLVWQFEDCVVNDQLVIGT